MNFPNFPSHLSSHTEIKIALEAARRGGEVLLNYWQKLGTEQIHEKGKGDLVTSADIASEEIITNFLSKEMPEAAIICEEGTHRSGEGSIWYVDPLDGTTNFVQQFPVFAVSIGLVANFDKINPELLAGVVYNPVSKEYFYGAKNKGSFLNDKRLKVAQKTDFKDAVVATGFPQRNPDTLTNYIKEFDAICRASHAVRRAGAAALDLCWTAQGIFDGFWEHHLSPWDIAAGALILQEAGGVCSDFDGQRSFLQNGNIIGGPPQLYQKLLKLIQSVK